MIASVLADARFALRALARRPVFTIAAATSLGLGIAAVTVEQVTDLATELLAAPLTAAVVGPYADEDELPARLRDAGGR